MEKILLPVVIILISSAALLSIRSISIGFLRRRSAENKGAAADLVIASFKTPSLYWCLAVGLYIGIAVSELNAKYILYITKAIHALVILSITVAVANLSESLFRNYVQKTSVHIPTTGLVNGILKGTILVLGFMIVLGVFGISIAPLVTALGVGGLAVALALQDTLANLFSGMHILVEHTIRVGDFIRLESGQEGYVMDITWRTTRIRMLQDNIVIIPNHKLAQSIVTNYSLPGNKMGIAFTVGTTYSSDPEGIEKILVEEAAGAVGSLPALAGSPAPTAQLTGFGEGSLIFTLSVQVAEYASQFSVENELRKRILKRFREEGIEMPLPQRTVYLRQEHS